MLHVPYMYLETLQKIINYKQNTKIGGGGEFNQKIKMNELQAYYQNYIHVCNDSTYREDMNDI